MCSLSGLLLSLYPCVFLGEGMLPLPFKTGASRPGRASCWDNEGRGRDITVKLDPTKVGARKGRQEQEAEYTHVARGTRQRKEK